MKTYQTSIAANTGKKYQHSFGREARLNAANIKLVDKSILEPVASPAVNNAFNSNIAGSTSVDQSTATVINYSEDALALGGPGTGITGNVLVVYSITSDIASADISITSLLTGAKWGGGLGQSADLTYSFSTAASVYNYPFAYKSTISEFRADQKQAARSILGIFSNVANLHFTEVADTSTSAGDFRFANADSPTASAFLPNGGPAGGDMIFGGSGVNPLTDAYDYFAMMHEVGHSLGLKHTHNGTVAGTVYDQVKYTVMSYRQYVGADIYYVDNYFPTTLMLDDVQALQFLYGINPNYKTGNDTYSWAAGSAVFETIVDSGGIDTINASTQAQSVWINLNSGQWSSIGVAQNRGDGTMVRDNLTIAYSSVIENATGSRYNDNLIGNKVANTLNGGAGADTMYGDEGNDIYYVDNVNDSVVEYAGRGIDKVYTSISYVLTDNVENARVLGTNGLRLTGNVLNNVFFSGSGSDTLIGGAGMDIADYFYSTTGINAILASNVVTGFGTDSLSSIEGISGSKFNDSISGNGYSNQLLGQAGNDTLNGLAGADTLDGGAGDDYIVGEIGNDSLIGGAGSDTMLGGVGNDTYAVQDAMDIIFEELNQGIDLIKTSVDYDLSNNIENAQVLGSGSVSVTGNSLNNVFYAGSGNNKFSGGAGADTVSYSYSTKAVSINLALNSSHGFGNDVFNSVESASGSNFNDVILGSNSANSLSGGAGNDQLTGGKGNDILNGGVGNDVYNFGRGDGKDSLTDSDSTLGNIDSLSFMTGINYNQLWFQHVGLDLKVLVIGTADSVTVKNWYTSTGTNVANHVEKIVAAGMSLLDSEVDNLVNAMAAFSPPVTGQTMLSTDYQAALNPVFAANWS